ncbi:MAG TPA: nuclear transport factor 2 family protein [Pyrinomonadaceae bacterium]|nr:nuclear transport factor 2 family protein [Pyrinomonadaceae bacterium]
MKQLLSVLFLLSVSALSLRAQVATDSAELTKMLNDFLVGAGKNDAAVHDEFWAEDLIYTRSAGVRINKEELMKGVRSAPAAKAGDPISVYTAEDIKINQYGNTAVVAFRLVSTTTKGDGTKSVGNNLNTGVFLKRNGKWQAVAWQSTVVPSADSKPKAATLTSSGTTTTGRIYQKGPRGGCYYLNSSGTKVYVEKSFCP